jgi:hypothetical protein
MSNEPILLPDDYPEQSVSSAPIELPDDYPVFSAPAVKPFVPLPPVAPPVTRKASFSDLEFYEAYEKANPKPSGKITLPPILEGKLEGNVLTNAASLIESTYNTIKHEKYKADEAKALAQYHKLYAPPGQKAPIQALQVFNKSVNALAKKAWDAPLSVDERQHLLNSIVAWTAIIDSGRTDVYLPKDIIARYAKLDPKGAESLKKTNLELAYSTAQNRSEEFKASTTHALSGLSIPDIMEEQKFQKLDATLNKAVGYIKSYGLTPEKKPDILTELTPWQKGQMPVPTGYNSWSPEQQKRWQNAIKDQENAAATRAISKKDEKSATTGLTITAAGISQIPFIGESLINPEDLQVDPKVYASASLTAQLPQFMWGGEAAAKLASKILIPEKILEKSYIAKKIANTATTAEGVLGSLKPGMREALSTIMVNTAIPLEGAIGRAMAGEKIDPEELKREIIHMNVVGGLSHAITGKLTPLMDNVASKVGREVAKGATGATMGVLTNMALQMSPELFTYENALFGVLGAIGAVQGDRTKIRVKRQSAESTAKAIRYLEISKRGIEERIKELQEDPTKAQEGETIDQLQQALESFDQQLIKSKETFTKFDKRTQDEIINSDPNLGYFVVDDKEAFVAQVEEKKKESMGKAYQWEEKYKQEVGEYEPFIPLTKEGEIVRQQESGEWSRNLTVELNGNKGSAEHDIIVRAIEGKRITPMIKVMALKYPDIMEKYFPEGIPLKNAEVVPSSPIMESAMQNIYNHFPMSDVYKTGKGFVVVHEDGTGLKVEWNPKNKNWDIRDHNDNPVNGLNANMIKAAMPTATSVVQLEDGSFDVEIGGRKFRFKNPDKIDNADLQEGYYANGMFDIVDADGKKILGIDGVISIARGTAEKPFNIGTGRTVYHEVAHAAFKMGAITEKEYTALVRKYGNEENIAIAYENWNDKPVPNTIFGKIKRFFQNIVNKILTPNNAAAERIFSQMRSGEVWNRKPQELDVAGIEKKNLKEKAANKQLSEEFNAAVDSVIMSESADAIAPSSKFSIGSWQREREQVIQWAKDHNISEKEVNDWVKSLDNVTAFIIENADLGLDYVPSDLYSPLKNNSDPHYKKSVDFSTLCMKRYIMQATIESVQMKLGRAVNDSEFLYIREILKNNGIAVSCGPCYVETKRMFVGNLLNEVMDRFPNIPKEYFLTQKGLDTLLADMKSDNPKYNYDNPKYDPNKADSNKYRHPFEDVRAVFSAVNAKATETRTEYSDEIRKFYSSKKGREYLELANDESGQRWQSWSDFELHHLLDGMQAIVDMSMVGLKGHAYTKVPDFARAFGKTGMMINLSLIPVSIKGLKPGFDAEGKLMFDPIEGMPLEIALELRKLYSDTVGTVAIGASDEHIWALMADKNIDYIIPYHRSGLGVVRRMALNMDFTDYTETQGSKIAGWRRGRLSAEEKQIVQDNMKKNEKYGGAWGVGKTAGSTDFKLVTPPFKEHKGNVQKYLEMCEDYGITPVFPQFVYEKGEPTGKKISADGEGLPYRYDPKLKINPDYYKLIIDRKIYNNEGQFIEQKAVKPIFDDKLNQEMLKGYAPPIEDPHMPSVDKAVNDILNDKMPIKWKRDTVEYKGQLMSPAQVEVAKAQEKAAKAMDKSIKDAQRLAAKTTPSSKQFSTKSENSLGQPIHPTEEGIKNFNKWFGDSKVVDEQGRPMVVYHGTNAEFTVFDTKTNTRFGDQNKVDGIWLTTSKEVAKYYNDKYTVKEQQRGVKKTDNIMDLYVSLKNPLIIDAKKYAEQYHTENMYFKINGKKIYDINGFKNNAVYEAQNKGKDGIIFKNGYDGIPLENDVIFAFNDTQIKSATGNNGDFSGKNSDIRFSTKSEKGLKESEEQKTPQSAPVKPNQVVDVNKTIESVENIFNRVLNGENLVIRYSKTIPKIGEKSKNAANFNINEDGISVNNIFPNYIETVVRSRVGESLELKAKELIQTMAKNILEYNFIQGNAKPHILKGELSKTRGGDNEILLDSDLPFSHEKTLNNKDLNKIKNMSNGINIPKNLIDIAKEKIKNTEVNFWNKQGKPEEIPDNFGFTKKDIIYALSKGKNVPPEVLTNYPDLTTAPIPPKPEASLATGQETAKTEKFSTATEHKYDEVMNKVLPDWNTAKARIIVDDITGEVTETNGLPPYVAITTDGKQMVAMDRPIDYSTAFGKKDYLFYKLDHDKKTVKFLPVDMRNGHAFFDGKQLLSVAKEGNEQVTEFLKEGYKKNLMPVPMPTTLDSNGKPVPPPPPEEVLMSTSMGNKKQAAPTYGPGVPNDEVYTLNDIIDTLNSIGLKSRKGGFRAGKGVLGIFKPFTDVIRIKTPGDIQTMIHENGHFFHSVVIGMSGRNLKPIPPAFAPELEPLAYAGAKDKMTEGFAEWMVDYIYDPAKALADAPTFYKYFESQLGKNAELSKGIQLLRKQVLSFKNQSALQQVMSTIVTDPQKPKSDSVLTGENKVIRALFDDEIVLQQMVQMYENQTGTKLPATSNPKVLSALAKVSGVPSAWISKGVTDNMNKIISEPLQDIVKGLSPEEMKEFSSYLIAKESIDYINEKGNDEVVPLPKETYEAVVKQTEAKYKALADRIYRYQEHLLNFRVEQGLISAEDAKAWRQKRPHYVPLYRDVEMETGGKQKGGEISKKSYERKGSLLPMHDPIMSIIRDTYLYHSIAARNEMITTTVDLARRIRGGGVFADPIPAPMKMQTLTIEDIVSAAEGQSIGSLVDIQKDRTLFIPGGSYNGKSNVVRIYRNGKAEFYEVAPDIFRMLTVTEPNTWKALKQMTEFLRIGAIDNPDFMSANLVRDMQAIMINRTVKITPKDMINAWKYIATGKAPDSVWQQFNISVGYGASLVGADRVRVKEALDKMRPPQNMRERFIQVFSNGYNSYKDFISMTDLYAKFTHYGSQVKWADAKTRDELVQAVYDAIDQMPFQQKGEWVKKTGANKVWAFLNSNLQGNYRDYRTLRNPETRGMAIMRGVLGLTLPATILYFRNKDDEDYNRLPDYIRDKIFWVRTPKGVVMVPLPYMYGLLFKAIPERILRTAVEKDPKAWRHIEQSILAQSPATPFPITAISPEMQIYWNRTFAGTPLIPESEKRLPGYMQAGANTSKGAMVIGKMIAMAEKQTGVSNSVTQLMQSPRVIQTLFTGHAGRLGGYVLDIIGLVGKGKLLPPQPSIDLQEKMPGISSWVPKEGMISQQQNDVYEDIKKYERRLTEGKKGSPLYKELNPMEYLHYAELSGKLNMISATTKAEKIVRQFDSEDVQELLRNKPIGFELDDPNTNIHDAKRKLLLFLNNDKNKILDERVLNDSLIKLTLENYEKENKVKLTPEEYNTIVKKYKKGVYK